MARSKDIAAIEAELEAKDEPKDEDEMDDYGFLTPPGLTPVDGAVVDGAVTPDNTPAEPKTYTGTSGNADIDAYFDGLIQQGMSVAEVIKRIGKERLKGRLTEAEFKALLLKYVPEGADVINTYKVGQ